MTSWSCHRLRPELVDFAEGKLDEPRRALLERHLGSCPDCAGAVIELREVPGALRRLAPADPPEEFWKRQRSAILDAIGDRPAAAQPATRTSRSSAWRASIALAASLAAVVVAAQRWTAPAPSTPVSVAARPAVAPAPVSAPVQVASLGEPAETTASAWQQQTVAASDNVLYVEDTSLLSLAEQLDDDSSDGSADSLI